MLVGCKATKKCTQLYEKDLKQNVPTCRNAPETLQKRPLYRAWCVCVVSTIVASIKRSLGLVMACEKVGATHSPARGYGATHSPCFVRGICIMSKQNFDGTYYYEPPFLDERLLNSWLFYYRVWQENIDSPRRLPRACKSVKFMAPRLSIILRTY